MSVSFELPKNVEDDLRRELGDLNRAAKEGLLVECCRQARISIGYLSHALGMGVIEADEWLRKQGDPLNYGPEDLRADVAALERALPDTQQ